MDEQYLGRRTGLRTNSLIGMVNIIQKTDLIGIIPREFFDYLGGNDQLKEIITPEPLPSIMIYIIYNRSSMNTPSFAKVIERISAHDKFIE